MHESIETRVTNRPLPQVAVRVWRAATAAAVVLTAVMILRRSTYPEFFGRYSGPLLGAIVIGTVISVVLVTARRTGLLAAVYQARTTIGAVCFSLLFTFVLLELGVRLVDPFGASYFEATRRYELDKVPDDLLVYRHPPSTVFEYQGVEVRLNELGLRDRPMRPRDAVKHRVLFLGDSVVFGWGVPEDETVSTVLEGLLTDRFEGPVGVVNTGVGSYNTVQQEKFLTHYGLSMRPDAVILLYVANDVQVHTPPYNPWARVALADKPPLTALDLIAHRSWLVRLFHFMKSDGRLGPPLGGPGSPGWTASMQALRAIQERCDDANIDFVPVFFRWRTHAEQRLFDDVQRTLRPMTLHDTAEWFAGRPIERYVNSRIDSHPNGRAHQIMAHEIAKIVAPRLRTRDDAFRSAD